MSVEKVAFLEMFPFCESLGEMCGGLSSAQVISTVINSEKMEMEIKVLFPRMPAPAEKSAIEARIAGEFGLRAVNIAADYPRAEPAHKARKPRKAKEEVKGEVLMGKAVTGKPVPMRDITLESGSVIVQGEVFSVDSREIQKRAAAVLSFDITDYTGSIRVSKYIRGDEDKSIIDKIKKGMYLTVQCMVAYNRYDEDISLEPKNIVLSQKPQRQDVAERKRVELHLHTRYSALEALCDPEEAVKRAAQWGHAAVAITDHGVAHAFPEAWNAAKKHGVKVIYGLEGYLINDVNEKLAVHGESDRSLTDEFVAFDIETTGLDSEKDRITEIGAVIFRGGEALDRFEIFVNPGMPLPREVVELTGITDRDVFDAPGQGEAVEAFLRFAGDRPLVAHNAEFDIGFIEAACRRNGLPFNLVYLDTLAIAQSLMPELKKYRLDVVAERLGLPSFRHHRASDDAVTVARIMHRFIPMLQERGAKTVSDVQTVTMQLKNSVTNNRHSRHIILLVRNKKGLKNLYELISKSHLEFFHKTPIIPKSLLMKHREGLIIGSACEAGEVFDAVVRKKSASELKRLASFYDYLEIQPISNNRFMIENGTVQSEEDLRDFNRKIVELGRELGKPVVATGDVHFMDPEHEIYRRILLASKKFPDADRELPLYFKTTDEMLREFSYLGEKKAMEVVVDNPNMIADMCEDIELLPKKLFTPRIENSAEELKKLVYDRMRELYGDNPPEIVRNRVETELRDILNCNYDVIYMSAQKLVQKSLEAGYLVGSRGSVGSSIVAFLSGITEVNSLPAHYRCPKCKWSDFESGKNYGCGADMPDAGCPRCGTKLAKDGFDIPFETFLGFGGDKVPDIDLNFSGEYQAQAHKYTEELFGREHVFRAGTIGTLAEKTAYGFVKKYLEERNLVVTKAEENRLALGCVGVKRTTGQHPGGLVIIPQDMDVTDFCPVQHPADSADSGIVTTHFEYHSMEANLLKLDELGHDDPTMIKMLEDLTGIDAKSIPLDDPDTMMIFRSPAPLGLPEDDPIIGKTGSIGIPEFGTSFTRGMLVDTQPTEFDTLVRLSGFSHGTDVWLGNAKDLILSGTASIKETIGCRDDIMLYLISKGMEEKLAFKIMESVRKGKGLTPEYEEKMRSLGVPEWYIESCKKIKYLFPKAHAVAYVIMAFRIAWFKVHHPLAYYSAYFYRRIDSFDAMLMTKGIETVRAKIRELQNKPERTAKDEDTLTTLESVYEFYLRGFDFDNIDLYKSDATRFLISGDKKLRPPFTAISGLGEAAARDLVNAREGRQFVSIEELQNACTKVSQTHLEQLKNLGALGDLPETSQMSLFGF
ncbi:MAG: PolC-type DNA polymerase III [Oscillospiraceae bacterium]|jgi:DNA polymerase-3 subunit alpha (Gram-positive type)